VADNVSTDRTAELARARGRASSPSRRASSEPSETAGPAARGEILVFVDADIRMHPETFNEIDRALATGRVVGGPPASGWSGCRPASR